MTRETYSFSLAIDELHDVMALSAAAAAMHEEGSNESRVIEVTMERVHRVIHGLGLLELQQNAAEIGKGAIAR
jgi:hypothetical protein